MGLCNSSEKLTVAQIQEQKQVKARSRDLEKRMQDDNTTDQQINKLLLLGAGESGKSTLFKQMISIYGKGFPEEERVTFVPIIHNNVITSMQTLIVAAGDFGLEIGAEAERQMVHDLKGSETLDEAMVGQMKALWLDAGVQAAYADRSKFQLTDSASYFFERLEEVGSASYLPTEQDVLRSRVRTTGIVENNFIIEGNSFKMFDVGGQRNERKKWIHCFENVTAVLFVGVLSEYDMVLYEDDTTNRLVETLNLFDEIINSRWFRDTSMILFLNKRDMFAEKIVEKDSTGSLKHPLTACPIFEDRGDEINNYEDGCEAMKEEFLQKNRDPEKQIYPHLTCATDTGNVAAVFDAVKDIIIRKSLGEAGLV